MMKLTQIIGLIYQEANRNKDASIDSQATYEASDNKMAASDVNAKSSPFPSPVSLQDQSSMARIRAILEDDHSTDLETLLERYSTESADRGLRTKMLQSLLPYIHQCVQTLTHESVSADRKKNIFNIGLLSGLSILIFFPTFLFVFVVLFGLLIFRPFRIQEWFIVILGIITPFYFVFALDARVCADTVRLQRQKARCTIKMANAHSRVA